MLEVDLQIQSWRQYKKKDWVDFELEVLMIQSASERLSLNLQYQLQLELYHNHDFVESE